MYGGLLLLSCHGSNLLFILLPFQGRSRCLMRMGLPDHSNQSDVSVLAPEKLCSTLVPWATFWPLPSTYSLNSDTLTVITPAERCSAPGGRLLQRQCRRAACDCCLSQAARDLFQSSPPGHIALSELRLAAQTLAMQLLASHLCIVRSPVTQALQLAQRHVYTSTLLQQGRCKETGTCSMRRWTAIQESVQT